ncbi:MAG: hypothetical protein ACRDKJ_12685 [Actinomycetota bacterium]
MRETDAEIDGLQRLLDESDASAGEHLRLIFGGTNRLAANDLAAKLDGIFEMHLATLTVEGAPLVAPIDGMFLHGKVFFSVAGTAVRSRLLRRDARVSASYTDGSFAFIVHGKAIEVPDDSDAAKELLEVARELYVALYGPGWITFHEQRKRENRGRDWSGWIEPRVMFAKR